MDLSDRLGWILLGCVIGFILGYCVRILTEIKQEIIEVDHHVTDPSSRRPRDEQGSTRLEKIKKLAVPLAILLTVYAAFSSQVASNRSTDISDGLKAQQSRIDAVTACNKDFLASTITALNERTTYTRQAAQSNVNLQRAQAKFLSVLLAKPAASEDMRRVALTDYFNSLTNFVTISAKSDQKAESYPYPTPGELMSCVAPQKEKK